MYRIVCLSVISVVYYRRPVKTAMSNNPEVLSKEELELHQIMLSRTRLKSSMRTSTLMAGFALVRTDVVSVLD